MLDARGASASEAREAISVTLNATQAVAQRLCEVLSTGTYDDDELREMAERINRDQGWTLDGPSSTRGAGNYTRHEGIHLTDEQLQRALDQASRWLGEGH